jgi:hypothetical protein
MNMGNLSLLLGIYGAGDILVGDFIARKVNPTWIANIIENYIYVSLHPFTLRAHG